MGRKRSAAGFLTVFYAGAADRRLLPGMVAAALTLWLAFLPGCNSQGASRQSLQQFRPIGNTARLMQNAAYYRKVGRVELAVDELEQARMKEPNNLELLDLLIQCYEDLGDFDRAQELYEKGLAKQGGHNPAWENNRCYSLYLQGRLDQAETCFRKTLARQPDNMKARNNLGLVLCRQGREAEALAMWREALNDGEARQRMGEALAALGKDVPPSLAGPLPNPAPTQITVAASNPSAPSVTVSLTPKAAPSPLLPSPSPQLLSQAQNAGPATPVNQRSDGTEERLISKTPPRDTAASPGGPVLSSSTPEQPRARKATPAPEPALPPATPVPTPVVSRPREASSAPVAAATVKQPAKPSSRVLTTLELEGTFIEVKNGTGIHNQARDTRSRLFLEGFTVVGIGNHIDFGLQETVIAYRTRAVRVAQALAEKFFPGAKLEEVGNLSQEADVRISLGRDLIPVPGKLAQKTFLP